MYAPLTLQLRERMLAVSVDAQSALHALYSGKDGVYAN